MHTGVSHAIVVSLYTYKLGQNALLDRNSCSSLRELQLALQQQHSVRSLLRKTASSVHVEQTPEGTVEFTQARQTRLDLHLTY